MPGGQSRGSPKKRRFRRVRRYLLHYLLLGVFCLAIAFVMCYTVFFKLDKIKISGCTVYGETQIVDEIGAQKGESLFRINISNAEKKLAGKLPYIRSVKIRRQFPTTLRVEVQEEEVLGAVYTEEGFAIISTTGKVLESKVLALEEGIPRLVGIPSQTYDTGSYLKTAAEKDKESVLLPQIQALALVREELIAQGFADITYYDASDLLNLKVMVEDRLLLKLGTQTDMEYKLGFIRGVLDGKESGDEEFKNVPEEGTLDFSNPPALHTVSVSIDKVKNEEAYLDFGVELPPKTDNVVGGQQSAPLPTAQPEQPASQIGAEQQETPAEQPAQNQEQQAAAPQPFAAVPQVNPGGPVVQNSAGGQQSSAMPQQSGSSSQEQPQQAAQEVPQTQVTPQVSPQLPAQTEGQTSSQGGQEPSGGSVFNAPSQAPIVN
jgi:hypothetical protein